MMYRVLCEFYGGRRKTVHMIKVEADTPILACEKAERIARDDHGGDLQDWFAKAVAPESME